MTRRAARIDSNQHEIVESLLLTPGVIVHSLAGVANGVPDLLIGAQGVTHLVEIKDGEKPPSHRSFTPDQQRWIARWTGSAVVVLTSATQARMWARRIAAAPTTHVDVFGREDDHVGAM